MDTLIEKFENYEIAGLKDLKPKLEVVMKVVIKIGLNKINHRRVFYVKFI